MHLSALIQHLIQTSAAFLSVSVSLTLMAADEHETTSIVET